MPSGEVEFAEGCANLCADLDELVLQSGQGPVFDGIGQGQRAQEVAEIVGQRMDLEPNLVVTKAVTRHSVLTRPHRSPPETLLGYDD